MNPQTDQDFDFPSLEEIEGARRDILDRVASNISDSALEPRAYHSSHSSGTGKGHSSVVSNRPSQNV